MAVWSAFPNGTWLGSLRWHLHGRAASAGVVALMWSANPALIGDIDGSTRRSCARRRRPSGLWRLTLLTSERGRRCRDWTDRRHTQAPAAKVAWRRLGAAGSPSELVGYGICRRLRRVREAMEIRPDFAHLISVTLATLLRQRCNNDATARFAGPA